MTAKVTARVRREPRSAPGTQAQGGAARDLTDALRAQSDLARDRRQRLPVAEVALQDVPLAVIEHAEVPSCEALPRQIAPHATRARPRLILASQPVPLCPPRRECTAPGGTVIASAPLPCANGAPA